MADMGDVQARRIRVTYLSGAGKERLKVVSDPERYVELVKFPQPVDGVDLTLPFDQNLPIEREFWSKVRECTSDRLREPATDAEAVIFRRQGIPLRHGVQNIKGPDGVLARGEVFVYPFGLISCCTVDISFGRAIPIRVVSDILESIEGGEADISLVGQKCRVKIRDAASLVCDVINETLTEFDVGSVELDDHRIVTVIKGSIAGSVKEMPEPYSPSHVAINRLSRGFDALEDPIYTFMPTWTGKSFRWFPGSVHFVLPRGSTILAKEATENVDGLDASGRLAATRHRRAVLSFCHVLASSAAVRLGANSQSGIMREFCRHAANRIARLCGPTPVGIYWGLDLRALLDQETIDSVERMLNRQIEYKFRPPESYTG